MTGITKPTVSLQDLNQKEIIIRMEETMRTALLKRFCGDPIDDILRTEIARHAEQIVLGIIGDAYEKAYPKEVIRVEAYSDEADRLDVRPANLFTAIVFIRAQNGLTPLRPGEFTAALDGDEYVWKVGGGNEVRYRLAENGGIFIKPPPAVDDIVLDFKLLNREGEFDEEAV